MPMRQPAPTVAPWTMAPWPTDAAGADDAPANRGRVWATALSWKLVKAPIDDLLHVAAQHGARPHLGAVLENDVADDGGVGVHEHAGAELGYLVAEALMDMRRV